MKYEFTKIADNVPGSEGPVFDHVGRFFVVAPNVGAILEINESDGTQREHANTGGIPAGLQVDQDNYLWVADMKLGILRVSPDGEISHIVRTYGGKPIRGCNDCVFDTLGNLYFSAPAGSGLDNPVGEVYCRAPDGEVTLLDDGYAFSNGVAVSPDQALLVVAETYRKCLWAYQITGDEAFNDKCLFATLPGDHMGGPDGLDFDIEGNLLAANWGGGSIDVFCPEGTLRERIATPFSSPSNIHFGGEDGHDLYITEHTNHAVWKTRWQHAGATVMR